MLFYKTLSFYSSSSINVTPHNFLPLCSPCFVIFICWNKLYLAEAISRNTGFYKPKDPLPWCNPAPFDSDCSCYKAQCNHTEETCMRRHVVMINQSRVRRAGENWCRPTWDCQSSGVRWVQALSAVRARELSGDSADWLTNQRSLPPCRQIRVILSFSLPSPDKWEALLYQHAQKYTLGLVYLYLFSCLNARMVHITNTQLLFSPKF